jgi:hypothetical protein
MTVEQKAHIEALEVLVCLSLQGRGLPMLTFDEAVIYIRILEWKTRSVNGQKQ